MHTDLPQGRPFTKVGNTLRATQLARRLNAWALRSAQAGGCKRRFVSTIDSPAFTAAHPSGIHNQSYLSSVVARSISTDASGEHADSQHRDAIAISSRDQPPSASSVSLPSIPVAPSKPSPIPQRLLLVDWRGLFVEREPSRPPTSKRILGSKRPSRSSINSSSSESAIGSSGNSKQAAANALSYLAKAVRHVQPDAVLLLVQPPGPTWRLALSYLSQQASSGELPNNECPEKDWPAGDLVQSGELDLVRVVEDLLQQRPDMPVLLPCKGEKPDHEQEMEAAAAAAAVALNALADALAVQLGGEKAQALLPPLPVPSTTSAAVSASASTTSSSLQQEQQQLPSYLHWGDSLYDNIGGGGGVRQSPYGSAHLEELLALVQQLGPGGNTSSGGSSLTVLQRPWLSSGCLASLAALQAVLQGTTTVRILSNDERLLQLVGPYEGTTAGATADVAVLRWTPDGQLLEATDDTTVRTISQQPPAAPLDPALLPTYWALRGHAAVGAPGLPTFADTRARQVTERLNAAGIQLGTAGSQRAAAASTKWLQGGHKLATAVYGAVMARVPGTEGAPLEYGKDDNGDGGGGGVRQVLQHFGDGEEGWLRLMAQAAVGDAGALAAALEEQASKAEAAEAAGAAGAAVQAVGGGGAGGVVNPSRMLQPSQPQVTAVVPGMLPRRVAAPKRPPPPQPPEASTPQSTHTSSQSLPPTTSSPLPYPSATSPSPPELLPLVPTPSYSQQPAQAASAPLPSGHSPPATPQPHSLPPWVLLLDHPVEIHVPYPDPDLDLNQAATAGVSNSSGGGAAAGDIIVVASYTTIDDCTTLTELVSYLTSTLDRNTPVFLSWEPPPAVRSRGGGGSRAARNGESSLKPPSQAGDDNPNALPVGLSMAWPVMDPAGGALWSDVRQRTQPQGLCAAFYVVHAKLTPAAAGGSLTAAVAAAALKPMLTESINPAAGATAAAASVPASGTTRLPRWCLVTHDLKRFARQCAAAGVRVPAPPSPRQHFDTLAATYVFNAELFKPPGSSVLKPDSVHRMSEYLRCLPYVAVHNAMQASLYGGGGAGDPRVAAAAEVVHNAMCYMRLQQAMKEARQEATAAAFVGGNGQRLVLDPCDLITEIEIPVQVVLAEMEMAGFGVDLPAMRKLDESAKTRMQELVSEVRIGAGFQVDLSSPAGKKVLLFDRMGLDKKAKYHEEPLELTAKGQEIATTQANLEIFAKYDDSGLVRLLLEYAQLDQLVKTYTNKFIGEADEATSRLYPTYNQVGTATGRLSTSGANLMALPQDREAQGSSPMGAFRRCLVAPPGRLLLAADYSQVELRVGAHITQDPWLVHTFSTRGDVHRETASRLFGVAPAEVTAQQRQDGKRANFGLVYGMGPTKLSRDMGLSESEARGFMARFKDVFATMLSEMNAMKAEAFVAGFATSLMGRRRVFRGSWDNDKLRQLEDSAVAALEKRERCRRRRRRAAAAAGAATAAAFGGGGGMGSVGNSGGGGGVEDREEAEAEAELAKVRWEMVTKLGGHTHVGTAGDSTRMRELGNMSFQGSTSDVVKSAMVRTVGQLATHGSSARLLLMIHDELVFEVPEHEVEIVGKIVRQAMESTANLRVPLEVEVEVGPNMMDMRELRV